MKSGEGSIIPINKKEKIIQIDAHTEEKEKKFKTQENSQTHTIKEWR